MWFWVDFTCTARAPERRSRRNGSREIGCRLKTWPSVYYTGHCTGETAFGQMKEILGEQLQPMSGGMEVHIF